MQTNHHQRIRVLLLGGTSEASALAARFAADSRFDAILSLAGRTAHPAPSPIPARVGGFGGASGLAASIASAAIDLVIDATHPFAGQISANAIKACREAGRPLITLERPPWCPKPGDDWHNFASVREAIAALPAEPQVVFSGLGRLSLADLQASPQHRYIIRVIDPPAHPLPLPHALTIIGRGPFKTEEDIRLFRDHRVAIVLAKNAGGQAAISKIEAARALGLRVMMIDRPAIPKRPTVSTVDDAWNALEDYVALSREQIAKHAN